VGNGYDTKSSMRTPDQRDQRTWVRDPFLFGMALAFLSAVTIILAVAGRVFGDPALMALAVVSVGPAMWLFYQRDKALSGGSARGQSRRR
jgi:hypothetical protein